MYQTTSSYETPNHPRLDEGINVIGAPTTSVGTMQCYWRQPTYVFKPGVPCCRPACAWFLKIVSVWMSACVCVCVCMCVSLPPRLLITSGMIWCDMNPI